MEKLLENTIVRELLLGTVVPAVITEIGDNTIVVDIRIEFNDQCLS
jgi:ribosomal protein S1